MIVSNPANRNRRWEGQFLVDTGATDSLVPRQHLEAIGVRPEAQRTYVLADGSEIRMDIAVARIELMGEIMGGPYFSETKIRSRCSASRRWSPWVLKSIRSTSNLRSCLPYG